MDKILIGFGSLILGMILGVQISFFASDHPFNLKYDEMYIDNGRYLRTIDFKNHSYIYLRNSWNSAGDQLLHAPDCKCYQKESL